MRKQGLIHFLNLEREPCGVLLGTGRQRLLTTPEREEGFPSLGWGALAEAGWRQDYTAVRSQGLEWQG